MSALASGRPVLEPFRRLSGTGVWGNPPWVQMACRAANTPRTQGRSAISAGQAYVSVVDLMRKQGGEMVWKPGGTGGAWVLRLENRTLNVRIPSTPTRAEELKRAGHALRDVNSLADAPAGARVRVGDDVLAPPARLATDGRVGSDPLRAPDWLARGDQIDWSRAVVDSCSVRAVYGGDQTGPNPTDRAKRGSKRHLICDGRGVPLAVRLTGANRNDTQEALALVDPPAAGPMGATAAAAGLCARGSRLRRSRH